MKKMRHAQSLFAKLTQAEKVIAIGSLIAIISVFLPWYRDLDAWAKGEVFLGLTGPLSLVGLIILIASGAVLTQIISRANGKEIKLLKKYNNLPVVVSAESILLVVIAMSVYLDPNFGVNLTLKETTFGLFLCLAGSITMGIGGYMRNAEPAQPELNVFEQVQENIERIHKDISHEKNNFQEDIAMTLAEKEYHEANNIEAREEAETLKMDI